MTGLLENVLTFNSRWSESREIKENKVGRVLWDTLYLMFFFSLLTASVRSRPYGPTLDIFMNQNKHNWQLLIHTVFFLLTRALLFTHAHIGGPSKLISGIPPYFDQTRRNMKKLEKKIAVIYGFFCGILWPAFGHGCLDLSTC